MNIQTTVVGAERVRLQLGTEIPNTALSRLRAVIRGLGYELQRNVQTDKLSGGVLNRRSGRLARSINTSFSSTPTSETASVGTSLSYGRIWEVTGSKAFVIVPKNKKALFWPSARHPVKRVLHPAQAPRPFLAPALEELGPRIRSELESVVLGLQGR